ncbi:MAG: COX15/CtaA family protein [Calditrichaeota bacterium]|nr:COX15/CtaA family protein [Calditrichota bacterium]MCB9365796.1 COX15/CtaA family protein [Calditrichota bacterium]
MTGISPARRLASWLLFLSMLITVLMLWGGFVRISGSGLSIPDWPLINGSLLPPFSDAGWQTVFDTYKQTYPALTDGMSLSTFETQFAIEYFHRFLAALVGIVFLVILLRARKERELWSELKKPLLITAVLIVTQAILGGMVVKLDLAAAVLAIHLGTAYIIFAILFWHALKLSRWGDTLKPNARKVQRFGKEAVGATLIQIVSGGLVAGTGAGLVMNTWPKVGDHWVPPMSVLWGDFYSPVVANLWQNQILIQFFHRWWAFVVAGLVIHLIVRAMKEPISPRGRVALRATATILVLQILLGIGNLLMKVPPYMAILHLSIAFLLYMVLIIVTHEIAYVAKTEEAAEPNVRAVPAS